MNSRLKLSAALAVAASTLILTGPAPAQAAACPGGSPGLGTFTLAFTCTQGDFTIKLNSFSGFNPLDGISFSNFNPSNNFTFTVNANTPWTSGTSYVLNYTVTAPASKQLSTFTNNSTTSDPSAANTWVVESQTSPKQTGTSVMTGGNGTVASSTLNPLLTEETFIGTLTVTAGGVQSANFLVNSFPPSASVPGPLPIVGAAAAFGFSRKVRNRIKAMA